MTYNIPMTDAIREVEDTRTRAVYALATIAKTLTTIQVNESNWADVESMLDGVVDSINDMNEDVSDFLER